MSMPGVAPDRGDALSRESRARGLREGDLTAGRPGPATAGGGYFPPPDASRGKPRVPPALHRETK